MAPLGADALRRQRLIAWAAEHVGELEGDLIHAGRAVEDVDELIDAAYARLVGEASIEDWDG